jgi:citrate synthase
MMKTEAFSPGLEGVIAGTTQISNVDPERQSLIYRGYDIRDLAEHASFEEVAYLLLYGDLPTKAEYETFTRTLIAERAIPKEVLDAIAKFPNTVHPMDLLRTAVAMLGLYDAEVSDNSHDANMRKAVRLLAKFPTVVAANHRHVEGNAPVAPDASLGHAENFLYMLNGTKPTPEQARMMDMTLVCYAEHGFNASTFSARVTASSLSDMHSAIVSAIGTLKGPLHGGANEEAMKMLLEVKSPENAEAWIRDALATKKKVMGFGHREYKYGDPRAAILGEQGRLLGEKMGQPQWHQMASTIEDVMFREKNLKPNVDFPTAYIYYMMGLPIPIYTPIFAVARISGWSANVIEQLENNRIFRPKCIYDGKSGKTFVPLAQR